MSSLATTISSSSSTATGTSAPSPGQTGLALLAQGTAGLAAQQRRENEPTTASAVTTTSVVDPTQFSDQEQAADLDNRFWNYGDADWGAGPSTGHRPPPGLTYSVPTDGSGAFVIHNNSDVDVAITNLYAPMFSSQGLVVIKVSESYTVPKSTETTPVGFTAFWVQTERIAGTPTVVGRVILSPSAALGDNVLVGSATDDIRDYIPLDGAMPVDFLSADPGGLFVDPGNPANFGTIVNANPVAAGVSYAPAADGRVTIYNDGSAPIAIVRATPGFQILTFDVLQAGASGTYSPVPGSWMTLSVRAPRSADGSMVSLGSVIRLPSGPISQSPGEGVPAIPLREAPPVTNLPPSGQLVEISRGVDGRSVTYRPEVTDPDGDTVTYTVVAQPLRGIVTANADGTFTYTVTDRYYLHYGLVTDFFGIGASDGTSETVGLVGQVDLSFTPVNNPPTVEVRTISQSVHGHVTYKIAISDPDEGQYPDWPGFDQPWVLASDPSIGTLGIWSVLQDGSREISYTPDLVRAHQGAYTTTFDVVVDDRRGGRVVVPITASVPFYNQNPVAVIRELPGSTGKHVTTAELALILTDGDFDDVRVASVTTSAGGSAAFRDGVLVYTPTGFTTEYGQKNYGYGETITVVVDDGHGGQATVATRVFVANTAGFGWLEPGQARTLIFSQPSPTATLAADLVRTNTWVAQTTSYQSQIAELEAQFAPELDGYNETLQRYLVDSYARNAVVNVLATASSAVGQLEDVVRAIDSALKRNGYGAVRIATRVAMEFLTAVQRSLFESMNAVSPSPWNFRPAPYVRPANTAPKTISPKSTAEMYATLREKSDEDPTKPFYVEHIRSSLDNTERVIVYIGGTSREPGAVQSVGENVWAARGEIDRDLAAAVSDAIGSDRKKEILLVGYSQGGIDAINLANLDVFEVLGVVTFGAPLQTATVDRPAIHIRDARDPVPMTLLASRHWGFDGVYGESLQYLRNRVFVGLSGTTGSPLTVHQEIGTYTGLGAAFDEAVVTDSDYSEIASVLRKFSGPVIPWKSKPYGASDDLPTWLKAEL